MIEIMSPRGSLRSPLGLSRDAFTLIELLVVISIMAVLATLTIAFFPNAASAQREARAAMQVQGWLNIAKQRALRDQVPFGIRLIQNTDPFDPLAPTMVIECQYIQQPDDFTGGVVASVPLLSPIEFLFFVLPGGVDLLNGHVPINLVEQKYWAVQPGDSIELLGTGLVRQIVAVDAAAVKVSPPLPYAITIPTTSYRIIRAPRPAGEEKLSLPDNTFIDIGTNANPTYPNPLPPTDPLIGSGYYDIVFGPSGQVISRNVATANIHLWVRSPNQDFPADVFRGDPTIVSVFVRSGFVGAYPPARTGDPYALVK